MFDKKLLANEEMRWSYMKVRRLLTRLSVMKVKGKIECFIYLAALKGQRELLEAGIMRAVELNYDIDEEAIKFEAGLKRNDTMQFKIKDFKKAAKKAHKKIEKFKDTPPEQKYFNGHTNEELERCIEI